MAPIPNFLVRLASAYLTQALTRKLSQSPLFFRVVDRAIHEFDHLPNRIQGKEVPRYQAPLGMRENEWDHDPGEPHNEPSPFPTSNQNRNSQATDTKPAPPSFQEAQRMRARQSYLESRRLAERDRKRREEEAVAHKRDSVADELRRLQDLLRSGDGGDKPK
ncbi:hypothetical protein IE53DRAFT_323242 [Violaceomyces palustris]|uniref:Uncharacterized protein n=1 Tax=Violaceomyces palustris TaxID=1673888 RepID=A0ACD0P8M9_9BASI|nr:hypothetical protein IE53DRAFT_323242 [Violaceomyces palustris]